MLHDVREALERSATAIWWDLTGAAALAVIFYLLLHLPLTF
jgi:hypothetical protein